MSTDRNLSGRLFLCLIGVMLLLAGGVFEWLLWRSYQHAKATRQWPQVEALVLESEIAERQYMGSPKEYSARVLYVYNYESKEYRSSRISPRGSKWTKSLDEANNQLSEYPLNDHPSVWVNPEDHSLSILKHDTKAAGYTLWFPALIIVGGGGIVVSAFRK